MDSFHPGQLPQGTRVATPGSEEGQVSSSSPHLTNILSSRSLSEGSIRSLSEGSMYLLRLCDEMYGIPLEIDVPNNSHNSGSEGTIITTSRLEGICMYMRRTIFSERGVK